MRRKGVELEGALRLREWCERNKGFLGLLELFCVICLAVMLTLDEHKIQALFETADRMDRAVVQLEDENELLREALGECLKAKTSTGFRLSTSR